MKCIRECICILLFCVTGTLLTPSLAFSDATRFIPRIYSYSGELEIKAKHDFSVDEKPTGKSRKHYTDLREKLNLSVLGYVYHPRLITLSLKLSGGLKHTWYNAESISSNHTSTANEYELRALILPEHPYSLELFTLHVSPFRTGRLIKGPRKDIYSKGAIFNYKKSPLFFNARYTTYTIETGSSRTDSKTYGFSGSYYLGPTVTTVGHSKIESKSRSDDINENFYLKNRIGSKTAILKSDVELSKSSKRYSALERLETETLLWTEEFDVRALENLTWKAYFSHLDRKEKNKGETVSTITDNIRLSVNHRIYNSLFTNYTKSFIFSRGEKAGRTETISDQLQMTYIKKIPIGALETGFSYLSSTMERRGGPNITVSNEAHRFSYFISLQYKPILGVSSIEMEAFNITTFETKRFPFKDTDFMILDYDSAEILILSLPSQIDFIEWFPYEFIYVSYEIEGDLELLTKTFSYNVKLKLLKNRITPYYIYKKTTQEVLSGVLTRRMDDSPSHTIGVDIMIPDLPVKFTVNVQRVYSDINPSLRYNATAEYIKNIDPTTRITAKINYTKINYYKGVATRAYSSSKYSVFAGLHRSIPRKMLYMSVIGAYNRFEGERISNAYSLGGSLTWKYSKLDVSLSANLNYTDQEDSKRFFSSYYLNVKRRLF